MKPGLKPSLAPRIVTYLQKENKDVKRVDVQKMAEKHKYSTEDFFISLEVIAETYATIGQWQDQKTKVNYLRYYQPNYLTDKVQECLNRGDDW